MKKKKIVMSTDHPTQINDFVNSFKGLVKQVASQKDKEDSSFYLLLKEFFQTEPRILPIVSEEFERSEHANLHLAIENYLNQDGRKSKLLGVIVPYEHMRLKISNLIAPDSGGLMGRSQPTEGPVEYVNTPIGNDGKLACVQTGLYLIQDKEDRLVLFLRGAGNYFTQRNIEIDIMALNRQKAEGLFSFIRSFIREKNIYRGRIISLYVNQRYDDYEIHFHHLPKIERDQIILPKGILERIEQHTIRFSQLKDKLKSVNRHIKRGILLHGPPGTGKTLSAMYLIGQMPDRTVILLTGPTMGTIAKSCYMARLLQPSTIILEDVDLIAEERTRQDTCSNALLFELLNQMDGLSDDADILFLLTTNRPEILEPALASRPGRIDQAVEIPLPDLECRKMIFELYSKGLKLKIKDWNKILERTEGVSPAFIKELMRKATLFAADGERDFIVKDKHIDQALYELVIHGGELTKQLLGATKATKVGTHEIEVVS